VAECRATGGKDSEWTRTIEVTMRGPRYLSLLATDNFSCGGPHPDYSLVALVYDLATGAPVNWKRLLPAALAQDTRTDTAGDGTVLGEVVSPALLTRVVEAARAEPMSDPECPDALVESTRGFLLWPDAQAGGIVAQPVGLPHAVDACANPIVIATPEMRKLGIDAGLVDAIEQAHRQNLHDKTAK
jgi:hypothetical protein